MKSGEWKTPAQLEEATGDSWASIGARLRDFRKPKFGSHGVERKYIADGLFAYRLVINHTDLFQ